MIALDLVLLFLWRYVESRLPEVDQGNFV